MPIISLPSEKKKVDFGPVQGTENDSMHNSLQRQRCIRVFVWAKALDSQDLFQREETKRSSKIKKYNLLLGAAAHLGFVC